MNSAISVGCNMAVRGDATNDVTLPGSMVLEPLEIPIEAFGPDQAQFSSRSFGSGATTSKDDDADGEGTRARPLRVLIIDDDVILVGFLKELLQFHSSNDGRVEVETAFNGYEALPKVISFCPDVVLLDYMLPGIRGTEICRRIKGATATGRIRVIAMSGYQVDDNGVELINSGAEAYFSKPLDMKRLLQVIGIDSDFTDTRQ